MKKNIAILLFLPLIYSASLGRNVQITEVLASNASAGIDERSKTPDWIELRNISSAPVSLKNYRISDKSNYSKAFILPDTTLAPGGCALVWASKYPDSVPHPSIVRGKSGVLGHWINNDSFHFLSLQSKGDFTASVRVHNLTEGGGGESGLIIREANAPLSRYYGLLAQPNGDVMQHWNPSEQPSAENGFFSINLFPGNVKFPYIWMRIQRIGDTLIGAISPDNFYWIEGEHYYFPFKNNSYFIGFAFASGNIGAEAQTGFSDFTLNGAKYAYNQLKYTAHNCPPAIIYQSNEIHAPFALSQSGEKITLWNSDGNIEDTLSFGPQRRNVSYGIDGNGSRVFFTPPTPGQVNPKTGAIGLTPEPAPLIASGYHNQPFALELSPDSDTTVKTYYTTDLTTPDLTSKLYIQPIQIKSGATIRFRSFKNGYVPSRTVTRSFIFDKPPAKDIATVFLTASAADFIGDSAGIWANILSPREVPVHAELNDAGKEIFSIEMGAKNHGFAGQQLDQKPLDIQLSSPFGDGEITETVFPEKHASDINKLLLRNASQDWGLTLLRDAFASRMALKLDLDAQGYRPVRAYFNGQYWGMYQLREKTDPSFIASNHGVDDKEADLMGILGAPLQGKSNDWNNSNAAALDSAIISDSIFAVASSPFDLHNFIRYWGLEIFVMNTDWPGNNLKAWRSGKKFPQWRYIVYDNDLSFNAAWYPEYNMFDYLLSPAQTTWANPPSSTSIFRGFLQNKSFKYRFLSRIADFLNTVWSPENTIPLLDSLAAQIAPEIPLHSARWPNSVKNWENEVERFRNFLANRPKFLRRHVMDKFGVTGLVAINVRNSVAAAGALGLNSITVPEGKFAGVYFKDIPVSLSAYPAGNYEFIGWKYANSDTLFSKEREASVLANHDSIDIIAVYRQPTSSNNEIVINEIMYKAPDSSDTKDWIEIYNPSSEMRNLSGWSLKDDDNNHAFVFPEATTIEPDGFLVISQDSLALRKFYNYPFAIVGQFDFGFGRGDEVRIFDAAGGLVDSVAYNRAAPWPVEPDGMGASLELIAPQADNTLPSSWKSSPVMLGTPGKQNSAYNPLSTFELPPASGSIAATPNPANETIWLQTDIKKNGAVQTEIYDYFGRRVLRQFGEYQSGKITIELPVGSLPSGLYWCVAHIMRESTTLTSPISIIH